MVSLGLLILRLVTGVLLFGHGAQKLFGWFGGYGIQGTAGWLESLGFRPGKWWAPLAGFAEAGSGLLLALGLFHPVGSIMSLGPMTLALARVHWGRPIWVTEGGGELPVTNMAVATALALAGPGRLSLDRLLGIRVPWYVSLITLVATVTGIVVGLTTKPAPTPQAEEVAGSELQGGVGASTTATSG